MSRKNDITNIKVKDAEIGIMRVGEVDYISLTDLAKYTNPEKPSDVIVHWLSNKSTFEYLGLWEKINNPNFNLAEFREIKINEAGKYSFTLSPRRWIKNTNAIGITSSAGRYSIGVFAHPDIAFEFASWLSPEFKLYLIREFERLKRNEQYQQKLEWKANRLLAKANYLIQTEAIKNNIIPTVTEKQKRFIYAEEADLLNVALFGMTAKEWRDKNPELSENGNIRDYTDLFHLIILNNLENINAELIKNGLGQAERLVRLNEIAKEQMGILIKSKSMEEF
ncbi:KilA-N domain-containing protein [Candidatus Saccharibacteria bacterium]|nr:KilA-N domain-containing protein [Candidatus Saccharibacteria bacterium]